jgi:LytTr DNA-binding domain-containing protein
VTYVDAIDCDELRVILCLEFEPHAQPEGVAALKDALLSSPNTLHSVEVAGDFDFMTEVAAPDLGGFNRWWKTLANLIPAVVRRCEKSFVCKRFIRRPTDEQALWVRCGDELKRIDFPVIDKIVAEGDYARVYSQGHSWLLHATMHSLFERLGSKQFVQLHRSMIVRSSFIDRLAHEERHWIARLRDGTLARVAKSHVNETLQMTHSAKPKVTSSTPEPVIERQRVSLTKS